MTCPSCNTINPEGMRFCGMCGAQLSAAVVPRERRRVTVVFIDLAGFSSLTRDFDPEKLRDLADEIMTVVAGIVEDYDGFVDAFHGDGLIALFGAPQSHPDDPKRAVLAAAAGLKAIERIGKGKGYPLAGRAGVNTGIVIAGSVGSGRVKEYTVMGSAVNLASRLEAAAAPGEVWVGPETYEATRHSLLYTPTEPLTIRGFPDVTQAFRLMSAQQRQSDPYAELTFVGRSQELEVLQRHYQQVRLTAKPKALWLIGEPGSGKTRLLQEFAKAVPAGEAAKLIWLSEGTAANGAEGRWMQLARQLFELTPGESDPSHQQQITERLRALSLDTPDISRAILGSLRLLERRTRPRAGRPHEILGRKSSTPTFEVWARLMLAYSLQETPPKTLLVLVDNSSHDPVIEQLLRYLLAAEAPILVVHTGRGRAVPAEAETLALAPLTQPESLALLAQLANPLLEVATHALVAQVGGIPAYVLELGRALGTAPTGSFSGSLTSLLQARLDGLSSQARRLLALAALVGERCWEALLTQLSPYSSAPYLAELTREDLLLAEPRSQLEGQAEYRFQSELLRTAVLRMVPFAERPALHLRTATWLEQHAPLAMSALIGHHFEKAEAFEGAYPHYLSAAEVAAQRGEFERAFELYERLLGLELPPELLLQGMLAYAQAALSRGDVKLAVKQLHAAKPYLTGSEANEELRAVYKHLLDEVRTPR